MAPTRQDMEKRLVVVLIRVIVITRQIFIYMLWRTINQRSPYDCNSPNLGAASTSKRSRGRRNSSCHKELAEDQFIKQVVPILQGTNEALHMIAKYFKEQYEENKRVYSLSEEIGKIEFLSEAEVIAATENIAEHPYKSKIFWSMSRAERESYVLHVLKGMHTARPRN